jgi:hypothetical protein
MADPIRQYRHGYHSADVASHFSTGVGGTFRAEELIAIRPNSGSGDSVLAQRSPARTVKNETQFAKSTVAAFHS